MTKNYNSDDIDSKLDEIRNLSDKDEIIQFVEQLSQVNEENHADTEDVIQAPSQYIAEEKVENIIDQLLEEGVLYEPVNVKLAIL